MISPHLQKSWQDLILHQKTLAAFSLTTLFEENNKRFDEMSFEVGEILFDFSKQHITQATIERLCALAKESKLAEKRSSLFLGEKINYTETRSVLHTILRDFSSDPFLLSGVNLKQNVQQVLQKMESLSDLIHQQKTKSATGKIFTDLLCLGIGGSELGPSLVTEALSTQNALRLKPHFLSNIDGRTLHKTLKHLNPETTLCIISSKTFTTPETLANAIAVKTWYQNHLGMQTAMAHFLAVTADPNRARAFGVQEDNIFEFWEWVGGRYSIWSAVGLPIILSLGFSVFKEFLQGAFDMDRHFVEAPFSQNMPVLMGLIGIWNNNFWGHHTQAILPYEDALRLFPSYLQQLEMESNGKSVGISEHECSHATAPILFGGIGCNGQHAYMQLLHQGHQVVPVDFLIPAKTQAPYNEHHKLLLASCLSQSKALMEGQKETTAYKCCPGNRPSTTLMYSELTPRVLGNLLALYEHKVFVQGVIWGINSFDQWGVELGKTLAKAILPALDQNEPKLPMDSSTAGLIKFFQKKNRAC